MTIENINQNKENKKYLQWSLFLFLFSILSFFLTDYIKTYLDSYLMPNYEAIFPVLIFYFLFLLKYGLLVFAILFGIAYIFTPYLKKNISENKIVTLFLLVLLVVFLIILVFPSSSYEFLTTLLR